MDLHSIFKGKSFSVYYEIKQQGMDNEMELLNSDETE